MEEKLKHIIAGCTRNERKSQEVLYKMYFNKMMSMCMRYAGNKDEAMMILNDGFLKVFKNIHRFEFKGSFEGWVRRLVFNCLSDYYKKKNKKIKFLELGHQDQANSDHVLSHLYAEDIIRLIDQVPTASADVFSMYAIYGYSHKEIAKAKNISEGTSKWHLSNAKKILQNLIYKQSTIIKNG